MSSLTIEKFVQKLNSLYLDWGHFSDFDKTSELNKYKAEIKELNKLTECNASNIDKCFLDILHKKNKSIEVLMLMIALRYEKFKALAIKSYDGVNQIDKDTFLSSDKELLNFFNKSGLKKFFLTEEDLQLYSYLKGITVGLDSNARKNRGGSLMENECEKEIERYCILNGYSYLKQKTIKIGNKKLKTDFLINTGNKQIIIEVNNYNVEGSKIKSISEEYTLLNQTLKDNFVFVWVTNGNGWLKSKNTLKNNLEEIEHFISLTELREGYLFTLN